jgi:hypothetical protein
VVLNFECRILVVFKGAGFPILDSPFPLADSDLSFLRARGVPQGRKTRTLHKNREECGTRKINLAPQPGSTAAVSFSFVVEALPPF